MGKVITDGAASDTSVNKGRKTIPKEQKVRTKKKKRKRDLTDIHQRLFKSKKQNRKACKYWQSNFVKQLHRFADIREEYDRETKIDGKLNKERTSKRKSNRILLNPPVGIYRNGATGKGIQRSQVKQPLNDLNNARLQGNVLKLLDGYDSKAKGVVVENGDREVSKDLLFDSSIRNILQPTPTSDKCKTSTLGNVDGKIRYQRDECPESVDVTASIELPQKSLGKKKPIYSEHLRNSALNKYEELCKLICAENFEQQNFLDHFTSDPLTTVKKKLRCTYAESFHNQFLRDMIKRGAILNEVDSASTSVKNQLPPNSEYRRLYAQNEELVSVAIDNSARQFGYKKNQGNVGSESENPFVIPQRNFNLDAKRNEIVTPNLLFDLSLLNAPNAGITNFIQPEMTKNMIREDNIATENESTDFSITTSLEVNHSATSIRRNNNTIDYFEINELERIKEKNKPVLFAPSEAELQNNIIKKHLIKRKNQHPQTIQRPLNSGLRRHAAKQNFKVSQQVKMKNLKHIPAILRRCNNGVTNNNSRLNLFQESMHTNKESTEMLFDAASKQNVLFTPQSLTRELNENSRTLQQTWNSVNTVFDTTGMNDPNVQTCVVESPSLRKDEVCFMKRSCSHPVDSKSQRGPVNDIFTNKSNPPVQKTVMFTKKDSRNIEHCLYLNNLIADGTTSNSNVCIIRKNVPAQQQSLRKNICSVHGNCQKVENCYRAFQCSQNSDAAHYGAEEFKEISAPQMQNVQVHQKPVVCEKVLLRRVQQHSKCENPKCHNDQHVCYVVVDQCKDNVNNMQECSADSVSRKFATLRGRRYCQDDMADVGILKGVQNLKILPMEVREPQVKFTTNQCIENDVVLEEQPIKYLAFENNAKPEKIPLYTQRNKHVTSVDNVEVINPGINYRVVSCPPESTQKIILVPSCEQNEVVYVKQNVGHSNVSFEECSHPRKVILYRPEVQCIKESSNVCEMHVPKQNLVEIRKPECDSIVTDLHQVDNIKKSKRSTVNWEEVRYRHNHEHDACMRSKAIFYQK